MKYAWINLFVKDCLLLLVLLTANVLLVLNTAVLVYYIVRNSFKFNTVLLLAFVSTPGLTLKALHL